MNVPVKYVLVMLLIGLLVLTSCSTQNTLEEVVSPTVDADTIALDASPNITKEQAINISIANVPGEVRNTQLIGTNDEAVWYVTVFFNSKDISLEINATSGNVISSRSASDNTILSESYSPSINPQNFTVGAITTKYFSMSAGKHLIYNTTTEEGTKRIEVLVPGWTKEIMGVTTLVVWNRIYVNDELVEDTRDYLAQDHSGNIWYFGEDVDNYENDIINNHDGAWIAGADGAQPGILIPSQPIVGQEFRQEYYTGKAEDIGRVEWVGVAVDVPAGYFNDCVQLHEWNPLDDSARDTYYCNDASAIALEIEEDERVELVYISFTGALDIPLPAAYEAQGVQDVTTLQETSTLQEELTTPEEAIAIALATVNGDFVDIETRLENNVATYIVSVDTGSSIQEVIVDANSGEIIS